EPVASARLADAPGVHIYMIGMVGSGLNDVDEAALVHIGYIRGGFYTRATDPDGLAQAYERIGALETTRVTLDRVLSRDELAPSRSAAGPARALEASARPAVWRAARRARRTRHVRRQRARAPPADHRHRRRQPGRRHRGRRGPA